MEEFLDYFKEEMRKRKSGIIQFVLSLICACAAIWAMQPYLDALLTTIELQWIDSLYQTKTRVILSCYLIISIGVGVFLCEHVRKKAHISLKGWWLLLFVTIIYSYYRFSNQSPFEIWDIACWKWMDVIYVVEVILLGCAISYWVRAYIQQRKTKNIEGNLLLDNAITGAQYDFLDYNTRAHELMVSLNAVNLSRHAFSVGIVGEWGLGKSSLLNLFAKQVQEEKQILVRFFPRNAKKADMIQEEFFSAFTKELCKYSYSAHHLIGRYAYALNVLSSTKWLYRLIEWFDNEDTAAKKERVNDMILATGKRVFVIIEDLDRMTGPEILEVLKLIDANGNFRNTVFLSAYDKGYVNRVLNHVIGYGNMQQDFTDKFFQYELPLFIHPNIELYNFITEKMYEWALAQHTEFVFKQQIQQEWNNVYAYLKLHIHTLRQAKRYINLFRMTYNAQKFKVDFADCALVCLIRYLDYQSYYDLYNREYLRFDGILQSDKSQYKLAEDYQKRVSQSAIPHFDQMLSFLFDTNGVRQLDAPYNRICRTEAFENYFYHTVKGKVYYGELNVMMNADTLEGAILVMQSVVSKAPNASRSIREFLWDRKPDWVRTPTRLQRYMCMLLYADGTIPNIGLMGTINDMTHKQVAAGYEKFMSKEEYVNGIVSAFTDVLQYTPLSVGKYMCVRLKERYSDLSLSDEFAVESLYQDQTIMEEAQRYYDDAFGKAAWSAAESINLAMRINGEEETSYKVRAMHLRRMMTTHPDDYAKAMIKFYVVQQGKHETYVEINYYHEISEVMGGQRGVTRWLLSISDADISYILRELNFYAQSGFEHGTGLGELLEFPSKNYAKVAEILRNSDARANIQASKRKEGGRVSKSVVEKGNKKKAISL